MAAHDEWEVDPEEDGQGVDLQGTGYGHGSNVDLPTFEDVDNDLASWTRELDVALAAAKAAHDVWADAMERHAAKYPRAYIEALAEAEGKVTTAKVLAEARCQEEVILLRKAEGALHLAMEVCKNRRAQISGAQTRARLVEQQAAYDRTSR